MILSESSRPSKVSADLPKWRAGSPLGKCADTTRFEATGKLALNAQCSAHGRPRVPPDLRKLPASGRKLHGSFRKFSNATRARRARSCSRAPLEHDRSNCGRMRQHTNGRTSGEAPATRSAALADLPMMHCGGHPCSEHLNSRHLNCDVRAPHLSCRFRYLRVANWNGASRVSCGAPRGEPIHTPEMTGAPSKAGAHPRASEVRLCRCRQRPPRPNSAQPWKARPPRLCSTLVARAAVAPARHTCTTRIRHLVP